MRDCNQPNGIPRMAEGACRRVVHFDGSIFPATGGLNPSLTIPAMALRTAGRIERLNQRGEL